MGPTSTSHRQGRAPSRRVVSAGGLHRHDAHRDKPGRRPLLQPARDGRAVNQGRQGSRPLDPPLLPPLPSQRGPPAARGHRLQPWQPATPAGLARRHPLVPDEPATAALQDRRAPHPPCPVLHAAACGELLDTAPVPPDYRPHRATRVAPDVIQRSASREADRRRWKCSCVGGHERQGLGGCEVSGAGTARASRVTRLRMDSISGQTVLSPVARLERGEDGAKSQIPVDNDSLSANPPAHQADSGASDLVEKTGLGGSERRTDGSTPAGSLIGGLSSTLQPWQDAEFVRSFS